MAQMKHKDVICANAKCKKVFEVIDDPLSIEPHESLCGNCEEW